MKKITGVLLLFVIVITAFRNKDLTITGNIKDENGNAIAATIKAGGAATTADAFGNYVITVSDKQEYIIVSFSGYVTQKIKINKQNAINVTMKPGSSTMSDSVKFKTDVTGYGAMSGELTASAGAFYSNKSTVGTVPYTTHDYNTEEYSNITDNGFRKVTDEPLSTFSIDVDAASYSNVRRYINENLLPPAGAVRTEEMINYFKYQYPQPTGKDPFSISTEISECPWNVKDKLVLIGLQGKNIPEENLPPSNLIFLIDVSGSMFSENKLPLVKSSLKMLTDKLREKDRISIVVYAGKAGLVLPATSGSNKTKIKNAIDALEAGGSTAGGAGIELAYTIAQKNFMQEGNNRIILCTDGDFNVGASSDDDVVRLIEAERTRGIYLSVLGVGMGNYKDSKMEMLADKGNGNYAYIDGVNEAKKVLVNEFGGTLFTIAKDVKLQVEFNPAKVTGYRLIGYENRLLNKEDFNDNKKDAGELGSGHTVTALYEIIPSGVNSDFLKSVDPLKYQNNDAKVNPAFNAEMLTVKFRYKRPGKDNSELIVHPVVDKRIDINSTSDNYRFAVAVAGFAMLLRNSEYKGKLTWYQVINIANGALGKDDEGYRKEFVSLVTKAKKLAYNTIKG